VDDYEANHRVFKITMQINKAVVDSKKKSKKKTVYNGPMPEYSGPKKQKQNKSSHHQPCRRKSRQIAFNAKPRHGKN
jgi:hypothetical protein